MSNEKQPKPKRQPCIRNILNQRQSISHYKVKDEHDINESEYTWQRLEISLCHSHSQPECSTFFSPFSSSHLFCPLSRRHFLFYSSLMCLTLPSRTLLTLRVYLFHSFIYITNIQIQKNQIRDKTKFDSLQDQKCKNDQPEDNYYHLFTLLSS